MMNLTCMSSHQGTLSHELIITVIINAPTHIHTHKKCNAFERDVYNAELNRVKNINNNRVNFLIISLNLLSMDN